MTMTDTLALFAGALLSFAFSYIPGLSAIAGVNHGVYRWRQLSSRSPSPCGAAPSAPSMAPLSLSRPVNT